MAATAQQVQNALTIHNVYSILNNVAPINFGNWDDITDWATLGVFDSNGDVVNIISKIISPIGITVYENAGFVGNDYNNPDADLTDAYSPQYILPVYTGTNTAINGSYTFILKLEYIPNGESPIYVEKTFEILLPKNVTPTLSISQSYDCRVATFTSVDTSTYCTSGCASGYNVTLVEREHIAYPPQVSGQVSVVADAETLLLGAPYNPLWTGTYESKLSVYLELTNGNYQIITRAKATAEIKVVCDDLLCGLYCQLKTLYNDFKAALGTNTSKADKLQAMWSKGMFAYQMAAHARLCSDEARVASYVNDFYNWTGADPSCGCCKDESSPVIPTDVINGTDGINGETPEFRVVGTVFQYQYPSNPGWTTLFDFASIAGENGLSFINEEGVPSNGNGENGDTYLDSLTFDLYKKESGSWTLIGNIKGADGADGADGVAVLYNSVTDSTTSTNALEVLKTYVLPAATMANDDILQIKARFTVPDSDNAFKLAIIRFNGVTILASLMQGNTKTVILEASITRTGATSAKAYGVAYISNFSGTANAGFVTSQSSYTPTWANTINVQAYADDAGGYPITCELFQVIHYKKI